MYRRLSNLRRSVTKDTRRLDNLRYTMKIPPKSIPNIAVCICLFSIANAQDKKPGPNAPTTTCSRDGALEIIQRQIDLSKTIDDDVKRLNVMLQAADLVWLYDQSKAHATFADAFEIANRTFKEKGDKDTNEGRLRLQGIDYRFRVISAIAKRDPAWGRQLLKQILDEEAQAAADKAMKDSSQAARTGEKIVSLATSLVGSDQTTALVLARNSLSYPAGIQLPFFLFKLAELNRTAADQFYLEALNAYARAPMDQFLYLSSYPFAEKREIGEMPIYREAVPPFSPRLPRSGYLGWS